MRRLALVVLALLACASPTEPYEELLEIPPGQIYAITAPGGTTHVDVWMVGAGGNNNLFVRGGSGAWAALEGIPLTRNDTAYAFVAPPLPADADPWLRPFATWFYTRSSGGIVLDAGTTWYEGGAVRFDEILRPFVQESHSGAGGTETTAGPGRWGFGAGGDNQRLAQPGLVRIRFYTR